jgi:hypothetical protein
LFRGGGLLVGFASRDALGVGLLGQGRLAALRLRELRLALREGALRTLDDLRLLVPEVLRRDGLLLLEDGALGAGLGNLRRALGDIRQIDGLLLIVAVLEGLLGFVQGGLGLVQVRRRELCGGAGAGAGVRDARIRQLDRGGGSASGGEHGHEEDEQHREHARPIGHFLNRHCCSLDLLGRGLFQRLDFVDRRLGLSFVVVGSRQRERELGVGLGASQQAIGVLFVARVGQPLSVLVLLLGELEVERGLRVVRRADLLGGADGGGRALGLFVGWGASGAAGAPQDCYGQ